MRTRNGRGSLFQVAVGVAVCNYSYALMVDVNDSLVVTSNYKCLGASLKDENVQIETCTGYKEQIWRREGQVLRNMETSLCLSVNQASGVVYQKQCLDKPDREQSFIDMRSLIIAEGELCMARSGTQQRCKAMCITPADNDVNVVAMVEAPNSGCVYQEASGSTYNLKMQLKAIMEVPAMKGEWVIGTEGGKCSKNCGGGVHNVEYVCRNKNFDNTYCELSERPESTVVACNEQRCEDWSEFGDCSSSDCNVLGYRGRGCQNSNDGGPGYCPGKDYEECYPIGCDDFSRTETLAAAPTLPAGRLIVASDGSKWTDYGDCSNTCGRGTQTAICVVEASRLVGHECTMFEHTRKCQSNSAAGCSYVIEADVDGQWSGWSSCCGTERQLRTCEGQSGDGAVCPEGTEGSERTCASGIACASSQQNTGTSNGVSTGPVDTTQQDRLVAEAVGIDGAVQNVPQTSEFTGGMPSSGSIGIATAGRTDEDLSDQMGSSQPTTYTSFNSAAYSSYDINSGFSNTATNYAGYNAYTPTTTTGVTTEYGSQSYSYTPTTNTAFGTTTTSYAGFGSTNTDTYTYNPFARRRREAITANPFEQERLALGLDRASLPKSGFRNLLEQVYSLIK
ncbi:hypothetical protein SARC_06098 [Sphaeroforma arctica JP610]|uniref:Uncharacterized protein n=1 Tax=Sphaeroforma arctica JP610 TaxID=667725 RepID=A0A0L0FXR1_9EUKA|nr:hypothetical protein SARC_06098 [Sphaeroforma arctica JP610]KNC81597.1 hypothetical protein SARC_06098 [Sphaeroforma arctica JP610]|eukprot:XP_014155499.1 hypothetical protein SARC_06098 [Sphaeroforma arctica JP610]